MPKSVLEFLHARRERRKTTPYLDVRGVIPLRLSKNLSSAASKYDGGDEKNKYYLNEIKPDAHKAKPDTDNKDLAYNQLLDDDEHKKHPVQYRQSVALQYRARHVMGASKIGLCGLAKLPSAPAVSIVADDGIARIAGVMRCSNPWVCAVCAGTLARGRARRVADATVGYHSRMITLTAQSCSCDKKEINERISHMIVALGNIISSNKIGKIIRGNKIIWARSFDETFSYSKKACHPHIHLSLFFSPDFKKMEELAQKIIEAWQQKMGKKGIKADDVGQDMGMDSDNGKPGVFYAIKVADAPSARARRDDIGDTLTIFDLLHLAAKYPKDSFYAVAYRNYAAATKGLHRFSCSRSIPAGTDDMQDAIVSPEPDRVITFGNKALWECHRRRLIPALLDRIAAATDPEQRRKVATNYLYRHKIYNFAVCSLPPDFVEEKEKQKRQSPDWLGPLRPVVARRRPSMLPDIWTDWDMYEAGLLAA